MEDIDRAAEDLLTHLKDTFGKALDIQVLEEEMKQIRSKYANLVEQEKKNKATMTMDTSSKLWTRYYFLRKKLKALSPNSKESNLGITGEKIRRG